MQNQVYKNHELISSEDVLKPEDAWFGDGIPEPEQEKNAAVAKPNDGNEE